MLWIPSPENCRCLTADLSLLINLYLWVCDMGILGICIWNTISMLLFDRSVVPVSATPWTVAHQAPLPFTISPSLLKLMSTESVLPSISSSVTPFSSCLQSLPASVFSNESVLRIRWPKYWSFSVSISPSNEYSELISPRIDWFDLLAVQRSLKSLFHHYSSKS